MPVAMVIVETTKYSKGCTIATSGESFDKGETGRCENSKGNILIKESPAQRHTAACTVLLWRQHVDTDAPATD